METVLASIALSVGLLVALLSLLAAHFSAGEPRKHAGLMLPFVISFAFVAIVFLLLLRVESTFVSGRPLAWGWLAGGAAALIAALGAARLGHSFEGYWPYQANFAFSVGLAAVGLLLLSVKAGLGVALLGCALSFLSVVLLCLLLEPAPGGLGSKETSDASQQFRAALEAAAILVALLAASTWLSVYHFSSAGQQGWHAYPAALAAFWLLGGALSYVVVALRPLAKYPLLLFFIALALSAAIVIAGGGILAAKMHPARPLYTLLAAGLFAAFLIAWLSASAESGGGPPTRALQAPALAALLVLFLIAFSYRLFAGFGAAVALLAGLPAAGAALSRGKETSLLVFKALALGVNYLLLRLFLERAGLSVGEVELPLHYTLIGIILGLLLPFIFASFVLRPGISRALAAGLPALAAPFVILALWGPDAALGLIVGLVGAQAISLFLSLLGRAEDFIAGWHAPTALLGLAMALVTLQFSQPLAFLYEISRAQKSYLAIAVAAIALLVVIALGALKLYKLRRSAFPSASKEVSP